MIVTLQQPADQRGWTLVFVQADHGNDAARALCDKLGLRREPLHFNIPPRP